MAKKLKKTFISTIALGSLVTGAALVTSNAFENSVVSSKEFKNINGRETFGQVPVVTDVYERVNFGDPNNNTLAYQAYVYDSTNTYHLSVELFSHQDDEEVLISTLLGDYTSIIRLGAEMFDGNNDTYEMLDTSVIYHDLYYVVSVIEPTSDEVVSKSITPSRAYLEYGGGVWNVEEENDDTPYLIPIYGTQQFEVYDEFDRITFSIDLEGDEFLFKSDVVNFVYNGEVYSELNGNLDVELSDMRLTVTLNDFTYTTGNDVLYANFYNTWVRGGGYYTDSYQYYFENTIPTVANFDIETGNKWANVSYSIASDVVVNNVTLKATTYSEEGTFGEYLHVLGSEQELTTTVKDLEENTQYLNAHLEIEYDDVMLYSTENTSTLNVGTGTYLDEPIFLDFGTAVGTSYVVDPGLREFESIIVESQELDFYQEFSTLETTFLVPNVNLLTTGTFDYTINFADGGTEVYHYTFSF